MEKKTEIILDMLTSDSVSVLQRNYFEIDGKRYYDGNIRNAFMNSESDRKQIKSLLPEAQYKAVIAVWGESAQEDVE